MIGSIRNRIQKEGSKAILWLMMAAFVGSSFIGFFGYRSRFKATSIATVNGDQEIDYKEYARAYNAIQSQIKSIRSLVGPGAEDFLKQFGFDKSPEELALDHLIYQKVEQSAAHSLGTQIGKDYIQNKLKDPYFIKESLGDVIPSEFIRGGVLDVAALRNYLQSQYITEADFEEMLAAAMERMLFRKLVLGGAYIPVGILKEAYEADFIKKKYGVATLSLEEYKKKAEAKKPSDDALKAYFEAHKNAYRVPEKRSAHVWVFDPQSYGITVEEKDLRDAYNKRKNIFVDKPEEYEVQRIVLPFNEGNKTEIRKQASELSKELKEKPELFSRMAENYSKGQEKAQAIVVKKGEKDAVFERFVFALAPGEITPPIQTKEGFEIVKLLKKKEATHKPFDEVRGELMKSLKQEKFDERFKAAAQQVLKQSQDIPTAFTNFAKDKKAHELTLTDVQNDRTPRMLKLFELKKAGDKGFVLEEGKGLVVELTSVTPSVFSEFSAVKDKVLKDFYNHEALTALEADTQAMKALVKDKNESLEKAAAQFKASYTTTGFVGLSDELFSKKAIPGHTLKQLHTVHETVSGTAPQGAFVVELLEKEPFVEKDFQEKLFTLRAQAEAKEERELISAVLEALRKKATIKHHFDTSKSRRA